MINEIKNFQLNELEDSKFITTSLATYQQNGVEKSWEIVEAHDSVAILIYHKQKESFVLVKQFRPAVYLNNNIALAGQLQKILEPFPEFLVSFIKIILFTLPRERPHIPFIPA